jgi:ABC-type glycerol-3-phosphate transport system permease component
MANATTTLNPAPSGARQTPTTQAEARVRKFTQRAMLFLIALALALSFGFPLYFMITGSFKAEEEILATPFRWLPEQFQGGAQYQRAFEYAPVGRFFFNSAFIAVINVVVTVFFSALAGYGFAKFNFRFKQFYFLFVLSTLMVPFQILVVPLYVQMRIFGWTDSYWGLIMPGIMNAFGVFLMRQFAYSIPDELLDAARIDGANEPLIFWRIVFPLLAPASASLAIIIFLFSWNNFLWPLIIVQNPDLYTLPVGMQAFSLPYQSRPLWAAAMAVSTLATLPVALLVLFFQRYFVQGMVMSGLKG